MQKSNYFITLEGIEGAGKTTAIKFISDFLRSQHVGFIETREPGGTKIAEQIRDVILNHNSEQMCADTELLLYFAARAQHLDKVIKPALVSGKWVICDRFTDATYAYQGAGRKITSDRIAIIENWVQGDLRPDLVVILDLDPKIGLERAKNKGKLDRIESEEITFFQAVREFYLALAHQNPTRYKVINANQTLETIKQELLTHVKTLLL